MYNISGNLSLKRESSLLIDAVHILKSSSVLLKGFNRVIMLMHCYLRFSKYLVFGRIFLWQCGCCQVLFHVDLFCQS